MPIESINNTNNINNFKYSNHISQNYHVNFRGKGDTVEISQKASKTKQKKNNTWKVIAGLGALATIVIVGAVIHHKKTQVKFEDVKEAFSSIFGKQYTEEEVNELLAKYKDIYNKKDSANYYDDLINQLKQDYGIKDVKTKLTIKEGGIVKNGDIINAGITDQFGNIELTPNYFEHAGTDFNIPFHELKHVKQYSEAYRADKDKFINRCIELSVKAPTFETSVTKTIELNKNNGLSVSRKEAEKLVKEGLRKDITKTVNETYGKLTPYKKGSAEYNKGLQYLDSMMDEFNILGHTMEKQDYGKYRDQIHEKEAWDIGSWADKIYNYIKQHNNK